MVFESEVYDRNRRMASEHETKPSLLIDVPNGKNVAMALEVTGSHFIMQDVSPRRLESLSAKQNISCVGVMHEGTLEH